MHLCDETIDDLLRKVFEYFLTQSDNLDSIHPRKDDAKEVLGAILELTNPRARLSRTEIKGTPVLVKQNRTFFVETFQSGLAAHHR